MDLRIKFSCECRLQDPVLRRSESDHHSHMGMAGKEISEEDRTSWSPSEVTSSLRHQAMTKTPKRTPKAAIDSPLSRLFGLSPAEASLAHAFLLEASIDRAAAREGLTSGTARQYMKQIFKKTGTTNQAQLMKLLLTTAVVK